MVYNRRFAVNYSMIDCFINRGEVIKTQKNLKKLKKK